MKFFWESKPAVVEQDQEKVAELVRMVQQWSNVESFASEPGSSHGGDNTNVSELVANISEQAKTLSSDQIDGAFKMAQLNDEEIGRLKELLGR